MAIRLMFVITLSTLVAIAAVAAPIPALAHQPYCEFADLKADSPWQAPDAAVSYAYYGNLYPATDVDYFTFDAEAGQSVLLSLSIPAIDGQEDFAPVMALFGPGIESDQEISLPARAIAPADQRGMMTPIGEEPEYWYEPFGGRYYWNWDNYYFEAPEDGRYTVVLWHPDEMLGRYAFVIGEREVFGGERECMASFNSYWTPLVDGENPYRDSDGSEDKVMTMHMHADGEAHDHGADHPHGEPLRMSAKDAPTVDLQVIPLGDGSYNVRVQTMNFIFAPHRVDGEHSDGEGHAHLYVDDKKVARIYGEWYHLETLPDDATQVWVGLYANNHQPLAVDGEPITDAVPVAEIGAVE